MRDSKRKEMLGRGFSLYAITSGEMSEIVPILDDGSGPTEYSYNYIEVFAREAIEARVKAVRSKEFKEWREWCEDGDCSPFVGLKVRRIRGKK